MAVARPPRSASSVVGQDRLVKPAHRIQQQAAAASVELAGDIIEEQQRQLVPLLRQQVGLGQDQPEQRPPLLAL